MLDRVNRCDGFSLKKSLFSSARGASFHTKQASNVNVVRVVSLMLTRTIWPRGHAVQNSQISPVDFHL
jgi:hypothetical protein